MNKYPRTPHLFWSKGATNDDKIIKSVECLINVPIVISEKCDGSNVCMEREACYARTHAHAPTHASFDAFKAFHAASKQACMPRFMQFFLENMYAVHSISYDALPSYFLLFGIREEKQPDWHEPGLWWDWKQVEYWADEFKTSTVPVLFKGTVKSEKELQDLTEDYMNEQSLCGGQREGVVVRVADAFRDEEFPLKVAKNVRKNHVNTSNHWKNQPIVKNKLKLPT